MPKRKRRRRRDPIFAKRQFADEVNLLCVRWYLRFKLSYRDLSRIMYELGIAVAPCTILRWVVRYSIELTHRCQQYQKPVGRSWRADETYVRVSGRWMYLDGFEPSHSALRRMGMRNEFNYRFENPVRIRSSQYLNNIVEQDHRRIKFRLQPMLGFKSFYNARRVIAGIELMQMIHKGQFFAPHY